MNLRDEWGNTPLHLAAFDGNKAAVALLIDSGADINAKDESGTTPLASVRVFDANTRAVAELLRSKGAI